MIIIPISFRPNTQVFPGYLVNLPNISYDEKYLMFYDIISNTFNEGSNVDIFRPYPEPINNCHGTWRRGHIIKRTYEKIFVHYFGFSDQHNEWIHLDELMSNNSGYKIRKYQTYTRRLNVNKHDDDYQYL